jgi:hypothetical protein
LDTESPHVLASLGTGGGKSVLVRAMLTQLLHRGAVAMICDIKRQSHLWARALPNVEYHRDIVDIHHALISLAQEGDRRNRVIDDDPTAITGPRIVVVMEEANATLKRLQKFWHDNRQPGEPKVSPAIDAWGDILFMGRAVRIHVIAVAQYATANSVGGGAERENFATRILGRCSRKAWAMLAPEILPVPQSSRHAGRVHVVLAGMALETQVMFVNDREAYEYALSGIVSEDYCTALPVPDSPEGLDHIGLRRAVESGVVNISLAAIRQARQRDPEFPKSIGRSGREEIYPIEALRHWERNRPRKELAQ